MATLTYPTIKVPTDGSANIIAAYPSAHTLAAPYNLNTLFPGAVSVPSTSTGGGSSTPSYYWS